MMEDKEKYENIVKQVFVDFKCKKFEKNNFVGALISNSNFNEFQKSFINRMQDIKPLIEIGSEKERHKWKTTIYTILNSLADKKNYEGAWAEFCALYELHHISKNLHEQLDSEIDVQANKTLGKYYNKKITNYDFKIGDNLLLDVKIFADKDVRIIQEWCDELTKNTDVTILPEISYPLEIDTITNNVQGIKNEIKEAVNSEKLVYQSKILDVLSYKIQKGSGILMATSIFDPYLFAKNEHQLVFKHFNKLHTKIPTVLVYVLHPWFSIGSLTSGFEDSQDVAFRSIARRLFMQYKNKKIENFNHLPKNATQYLSGIIFIVDKFVKNEKNQVFFYTNPNAKNKMYRLQRDYIKDTLHAKYDWFEYDNY